MNKRKPIGPGACTSRILLASLLVLSNFATASFCTPGGAARASSNFYVSPRGNNTTGSSWQTAWNELDQIDWNSVTVGSTIYLDGGAAAAYYKTSLTVPKTVTVEMSTEQGHNGRVTITGKTNSAGIPTTQCGIKILASGVRISGQYRNGISIGSCTYGITAVNGGINGTGGTVIDHVQVDNCGIGISLNNNATLTESVIHDNRINVQINLSGSAAAASTNNISTSWIYNSFPPSSAATTGVLVTGTPAASQSQGPFQSIPVSLNEVAIGPGLTNGFLSYSPGTASLWDCLFLNADQNQLSLTNPKGVLQLNSSTCFMQPLNSRNQAHTNLRLATNATGTVGGTIFYDGLIAVPAGVQLSGTLTPTNDEYNTTGNNVTLNAVVANPKFKTGPATLKSFDSYVNADFTPTNSQVGGEGSYGLRSIASLLSVMGPRH